MAAFEFKFSLGDRVHVDADRSMTFVVIAYTWRSAGPQVEISWVNNGSLNTAWVDEWRLSAAESATEL